MQVLLYNHLNTAPVQRQFDKTLHYLQQGDFRSADVRKMKTSGYYRARLDDTNRLLFKIGEYQGRKYLFLLEVILNHDYDKSRFLRGAVVREEKLLPVEEPAKVEEEDMVLLGYINPDSQRFAFVDKIISLNNTQEEILAHQSPLILLGSAGCGKTVLALEKMKGIEGRILYITLSTFLAEKARQLYLSDGLGPEGQVVDFLSFDEYLHRLEAPKGREASFNDFNKWFDRIRNTCRIKDTHKLFEEFRGVLTGAPNDKPYLSKADYLALGVRQSVFTNSEKEVVYPIFVRYLDWLKSEKLYDTNIVAFERQAQARPVYDFLVVDEVQDMTNVQLSLLLKSLKQPGQFIFCGDANQVVHPNFFSWTNVKRMLHQQQLNPDVIHTLPGNYRNTEAVTNLTNRLLSLKNVRFGSIDRESTQLVTASSEEDEDGKGIVRFFEDSEAVRSEIVKAMFRSSRIALLVLREEDKAAAKKAFNNTPLIFTVQEAKGLEFDHIVLYNFISGHANAFEEICEGIAPRNLTNELEYSRPKNKEDRSLQAHRFYINALYVAMTRALGNLFVIEQRSKPRLLSLLGVKHLRKQASMDDLPSTSLEDWKSEADRLEKYGKKEQADAIRSKLGQHVEPDWEVITFRKYWQMKHRVFESSSRFNAREKTRIKDLALFYNDFNGLAVLFEKGFGRGANMFFKDRAPLMAKLLAPYKQDQVQRIEPLIKKYGPNFRNELNLTPLMLATLAGAVKIARYLMLAGADPILVDNWGRTAFQLALVKVYFDEKYARQTFPEILPLVQPPYFHFSRGDQKFALPFDSVHFMIATIIIALQREFLFHKKEDEHIAVHINDFHKIISYFPDEVIPAHHRKREYIASQLAKADFFEGRSLLLMGLRKGYYCLVPTMSIYINDEWIELKHLFGLHDLAWYESYRGARNFKQDMDEWVEKLKQFTEQLKEKRLSALEEEETSSQPDDNLRDWPA